MSEDPRKIRVRNDNDRITYVGDWTIVQASAVNNIVNLINGPVYSPTLRSTTTTSSFTFPFQGSSISVTGSINIANLSNGTNQDPSWTCTVDGIPLTLPDLSSFNQQNIRTLCSQGSIPDGAHELVVNVTSQGMPFYLDFLDYQPSSDASLADSLVPISYADPGVDFISGWEPIGIRYGTIDPEGLINVTFIGVQLAWYGYTPFSNPHTNASSGKFSVDGQPYTPFQLPGLPESFSSTAFNQPFFTTPMLKMGTHVLSAKYTGSPGQSPFTLEYLIVTNGSFLSTEPSPTNSGGHPTIAPSTTDTSKNTSKDSSHVRSIVGGVVGSIGGIVLLILVLFCFKLRKRRGRNHNDARSVEPYFAQPHWQLISQSLPASSKVVTIATHSGRPSKVAKLGNSTQLDPPHSRTECVPLIERATIAPVQHENSSVRLWHPGEAAVVLNAPPSYSEFESC